jgi:hypothetical protein
MTIRELINELIKCKSLDEPVFVDGCEVKGFDYDAREILADEDKCRKPSNIMEVVDLIKGERNFAELSRDTGISTSCISLWYQGKRRPSLNLLKKMMARKSHPRYIVSNRYINEMYQKQQKNDREKCQLGPKPVYDFSGLVEMLSAIKGERSFREWSDDTGIAASYLCMLIKGNKYVPSLHILKKMVDKGSFPRIKVSLKTLIKYAG